MNTKTAKQLKLLSLRLTWLQIYSLMYLFVIFVIVKAKSHHEIIALIILNVCIILLYIFIKLLSERFNRPKIIHVPMSTTS